MYETIEFDVSEGVALLVLNRPDRLNALTPQVFADIEAALNSSSMQEARALLVTGNGRAFCSGADLQNAGTSGDLGELLERYYNPLAIRLAGLDVPVVTAVNGAAAGAGCALALAGDIVVMGHSAYLLLAFVNIGLVPDFGATWLVARSAGRAKTLEMALLGERLSATDALSAGLVTRVVQDDCVLGEARSLAKRLAVGPTAAIRMVRQQVSAALTSDFPSTLVVEKEHQCRAGWTADFAEAVQAFGEKRRAVFEGR